MSEAPLEWSNLPEDVHRLVVERSDFISRCNLRATSKSTMATVDSTRLFIPLVTVRELRNGGVSLKFSIKLSTEEHTLKFKPRGEIGALCQYRGKEVVLEDTNQIEGAAGMFALLFIKKNVHIGQLTVETGDQSDEMSQKFEHVMKIRKEELEQRLKVHTISWVGNKNPQLMWSFVEHCDTKVLKELKILGKSPEEGFELFGRCSEIVKNLETVLVRPKTSVTDEDVLSMNSSVIVLKSENFSADMARSLIQKFLIGRPPGSFFYLKTSQNRPFTLRGVPEGFHTVGSQDNSNVSYSRFLDDKKTEARLNVSPDHIDLQIGDISQDKLHIFTTDAYLYPPPDSSDESSEYDDFDDYDDSEEHYYSEFDQELNESDYDDQEDDEFWN